MGDVPRRKSIRLQNYDYSRNGAYFVTFCAMHRKCLFGHIVGATALGRPHVTLTTLGKCIDETIIIANRDDVRMAKYVIMPNHIHMIVTIQPGTGDRGRSPLQEIVRNIKSFPTKQIGYSPWQKSVHDHIIRNNFEYEKIWRYIDTNPQRWTEDRYYCET